MKYYVEAPDRNRVSSLAVQDLNGDRLWYRKSPVTAPPGLGFGRGSSAALVVYDLREGAPQAMFSQSGKLLAMYMPCDTAFPVDWKGDGYHRG